MGEALYTGGVSRARGQAVLDAEDHRGKAAIAELVRRVRWEERSFVDSDLSPGTETKDTGAGYAGEPAWRVVEGAVLDGFAEQWRRTD